MLNDFPISARLPAILATLELEARPLLAASADLSYWLAIKMSVVLLFLAALDYGYQRWQHERASQPGRGPGPITQLKLPFPGPQVQSRAHRHPTQA